MATRQLILRKAGFATDAAIGIKAALAAFTGRNFDVVVLCHTLTEKETQFLQSKLRERAPCARVVCLEPPARTLSYSPAAFLRMVTGS